MNPTEPRKGAKGFLRTVVSCWRRTPHIGVPALVAAGIAVALPLLFVLRVLPYSLATPFLHDFQWFYEAAVRFRGNALTLYGDPDFLYPPPSVLAFLPLTLLPVVVSYWAFMGLLVVALGASVLLFVRAYEERSDERLSPGLVAAVIVLAVAFAPVHHNLKLGQVGIPILMAGLLFVRWADRGRLMSAGLLLSGVIWLKVFPAALGLLGLREGKVGRYAVGVAVGLLVVPVFLLPVIPLELYQQYFLDVLPGMSDLASLSALNQSLGAVLERLHHPPDVLLSSLHVEVRGWARVATLAYAVSVFGGAYAVFALTRERFLPAMVILAAVPVVIALGWEHTYVLALPLFLYVLLEARGRATWMQVLATVAILVMMVPKLPDGVIETMAASVPRPLVDLFHARFLIATTIAIVLALAWELPRARKRGRPEPRREAPLQGI